VNEKNETAARPAWEDNRWTSLPHLSGTARVDICVIGLGGSGLSSIHALLDHGLSVVGIDAVQIAGGAAGANGGFLLAGTARFYHRMVERIGRDRACELYRLTVLEIERMQRELPNIVRSIGSLRIAMSAEELADCDKQFETMTTDQLPVSRYRGTEGEGLLIPTDAVFDPLTRCRQLAYAALERGARLYENTPAIGLHNGLVQTPQARIHCRNIVVAVDGKLDLILPELAGEVRTARLQMLGSAPTTEVRIDRAVYARWGYEYWQQLPDGRILLGGFRDHDAENEWTHSTEPTEVIQTKLTAFLREQLRVQAPITHRWAASVGYTQSGLPIVAEVRPNIWAAGGYNGTGNVVGALCGRAIADKIATSRSRLLDLLNSD
jgi:glycine/D-amino acid oxidase-like deaminating enzyme